MSRFFVIRRLASSAELANSTSVCAGEVLGLVDEGRTTDTSSCVSSFYMQIDNKYDMSVITAEI